MGRKSQAPQRREETVWALYDCLAERGQEKISIKEIAARAGLAPGVIHYYFKSKDDITSSLVKAIIEIYANGLHRKFTRGELAGILGGDLVKEFGYRLVCHDAEDFENLTHPGTTESGYDVEVNKLVTDSDLTVYVNTVVWRGFNGGWKSVCVGLGSYRSIRWHHTPDSMSMSMNKNRMHEMLDEMGSVIEQKIGKESIFKIETALANPLEVHKVWAGGVSETRREVLALIAVAGDPDIKDKLKKGCEAGGKTFIVSGGGIEFMRPWKEAVYGIPPEQVVGSSIKTKFEMRDGEPVLIRLPEMNFIDDKEGKPVGINFL